MAKNKILIIGHARHGKDTVAALMSALFGLKFEGSSEAAARIFLFDVLKDKYNYKTPEECFEDRVNHRQEWYELICAYNANDPARLAKDILEKSDIYVGMRSDAEVIECARQGIFKLVIGVFDPRKPLEPSSSFDIDLWSKADIVIPNSTTLAELNKKVYLLKDILV